jgi:hypothetical protein
MDSRLKTPTLIIVATLSLSLALAWVSSGYLSVEGWLAFWVLLLLAGGLMAASWRVLRVDKPPRWLLWLTVGAALVRLGAGVLWFTALPAAGYDTEVQNAGYIMEDAFQRDRGAWQLAQSDEPIWAAFGSSETLIIRNVDQYGGLLALSTSVYRFTGLDQHAPLLMVVLSAAMSALAVPFAWAFSRRILDERIAKWTAWSIALYPEAVLLGSSQMREAFMMGLAAAAFYGLARTWQERSWHGIALTGAIVLVSVSLSPPLAGILLALLLLLMATLFDWALLRSWKLWAAAAGAMLLIVVALSLGWDRIAPRMSADQFESPLAMFAFWIEISARWQARLTTESSGWVQRIFDSTPEAFNLPFLLVYGILRPFLPAQLTAFSIPIWWSVGMWRALGWALALPLLAYAPIRALRATDKRSLLLGLSLAVWLTLLIAAFWGGGDQWDNPRYRVSFIALQVPLAAWVVAEQLRQPDPWMRRGITAVGLALLWFVPWYLRRYTTFDQIFGWQVVDLFKLMGLGVATAVLYVVWDLAGGAPKNVEPALVEGDG